jgi:hypothetical protein
MMQLPAAYHQPWGSRYKSRYILFDKNLQMYYLMDDITGRVCIQIWERSVPPEDLLRRWDEEPPRPGTGEDVTKISPQMFWYNFLNATEIVR